MTWNDYNASTTLPVPGPGDTYRTSNHDIENVLAEFKRIEEPGNYLRLWDGGQIPERRYTAHVENNLGFQNHLQGFQRLRNGKYAVLSGGDLHNENGLGPASHVFVVKMDQRPARGPWGSNVLQRGFPPVEDKIVRVIGLDNAMWHAGGMQILGDILVVPIERSDPPESRVVFLNLAKPETPQRFAMTVERDDRKAAATALTRLANRHYLLAVWNAGILEFYLSNTAKLEDGFGLPASWHKEDVKAGPGQDANFSDFQTLNFIEQTDGKLFLIGLHNTSSAAPTVPGRDYADLYRVTLPASLRGPSPVLNVPTITKIAKQHLLCHNQQCNMDGAAGTYVDHRGRLHAYSTWHWRSDDLLRVNEFPGGLRVDDAGISSISDGRIDLYEDNNFKGRRLSLVGKRPQARISHYRAVSVQGGTFDNKVSSCRFQLPTGHTYTLYEDPDFEGEGLMLIGSGKVEEIKNLKRDHGLKRVRSSKFE